MFFEGIGILLKRKLVDIELVDDIHFAYQNDVGKNEEYDLGSQKSQKSTRDI
jgi:hypothetical protein